METSFPIDNSRPPKDLVWSLILIFIALYLPIYVGPITYPISVVIVMNRLLFGLSLCHEALHGNVHTKSRWNSFYGSLWSLPLMIQLSRYKRLHLRHHFQLNEKGADPDYHLSENFPTSLFPYLGRQLFRLLTLSTLLDYLKYYTEIQGTKIYAHVGTFGLRSFCIVILVGSIFFFPALFFFFFLPHLLFQQYILIGLALQHGPIASGRDKLEGSRNIFGPKWWLAVVMPGQIALHGSHHRFPKVPYYHLHRMTQALKGQIPIWEQSYIEAMRSLFYLFGDKPKSD